MGHSSVRNEEGDRPSKEALRDGSASVFQGRVIVTDLVEGHLRSLSRDRGIRLYY